MLFKHVKFVIANYSTSAKRRPEYIIYVYNDTRLLVTFSDSVGVHIYITGLVRYANDKKDDPKKVDRGLFSYYLWAE